MIQKTDSFLKGYNLTRGGTGGNTRFNRIIDFEQFCFIYSGNLHFDNMCSKTAKYFGCDSSTISAIRREISYDDYREAYWNLPEETRNKYLEDFIEAFQLDRRDPPKCSSRLTDAQVIDFLCLISCYGKGAEIAFLRALGHAKGLGHQLKTNKNYFVLSKKFYNAMTEEEILVRAELTYKNYDIQSQLSYKLAKRKQVVRVNCAL